MCLVSALIHTNFLIPPRSLASGCVTGAYATLHPPRVYITLFSSALSLSLFLSLAVLSARTRAPSLRVMCTVTKDRQFYTSFFNRTHIKRKAEGTRGREDPCSLSIVRQTLVVFQLPGRLDCPYTRNREYECRK